MQGGTCSSSPAVTWQKWLGSFWFVGGCSLKHTTGFCRPQTKEVLLMQGAELLRIKVFKTPGSLWDFHWLNISLKPQLLSWESEGQSCTCVLGKFCGPITPSHNSNNGHYHRKWMRWTGPRTSSEGGLEWPWWESTCRDWGRVGDSRSLSLQIGVWAGMRGSQNMRYYKAAEKQHQAAVKLDSERRLQCWLATLQLTFENRKACGQGAPGRPLWGHRRGEGSVGESGWLQIQTGLRNTQPGANGLGEGGVSVN